MVTRQGLYGDRKIEFDHSGGNVRLEVQNIMSGRNEVTYLTDEVALELADFILANVERPKLKTAADQIRELPIGGKFRFTDSQNPAVNVKISDTQFWFANIGIISDISNYETTRYGIEVIE